MSRTLQSAVLLLALLSTHCGPPPDEPHWVVAVSDLQTPVPAAQGVLGRWLRTSDALVFEFDSSRRIQVLEEVDIRGVPYGSNIACRALDRSSRPTEEREYLELSLSGAETAKSSALGTVRDFCPKD